MPAAPLNLKTHPLTGVSLIEASAGTGKTYTITHLYLRCLLETDYEVNQLLVVTFTNAATQELKGRIRTLLYELWSYLQDSSITNAQFDTLFSEFRSNPQALFKLHRALVNFDEAAIYSIHGFCQRVLNSFPVETLSLLQQQIIPDETEIEISAIRDYWRQHIINCEVAKLRWIIANWNHPDSLLADVRPLLGFDQPVEKTAQNLNTQTLMQHTQQSWDTLCREWQTSSAEIQDFLMHSPLLNRARVRKPTVISLIDELQGIISGQVPFTLPQKWELLTATKLAGCVKKNEQDERLHNPFFSIAEDFQTRHEDWIKNHKISILISAAHSVQQSVDKTKLNAQNISFNDLITKLSHVLTGHNRSLIEKIGTLYPFAMVDEFQDTDHKQYHIFKTLYQQHSDKTLILIGDPKQAIYSFRGADVFTYQQAKQSTENHFTLEINYRSTADYIDLINRLFAHNQNAFIYSQLIDFIPAKTNVDSQKIITEDSRPVTPLVSWIHPYTDKALSKGPATDYFAGLCADEIYNILRNKTLQLDGVTVAAKDLCILVKTGRQASLMKNRLAERGIGSALILRDSVFATGQARDISLLLEVLIEPDNISRLCGLLSTDLFGWNAQQIYQLQNDNQQLVYLLEQMKTYQQHWLDKGILSMFFKLLEDQQTLQKNIQHMDGERRMTNWLHIMELLQQQANRHASLTQALHWLLQQREQLSNNNTNEEHQLRLESDSNLVRIVTIHKSKGLQYPIVFLPFMWDMKGNRYRPDSYSYHDEQGNRKLMIVDETQRERWHQENLAEEIRLLYVAMTRAIYRCYLGWGFIKGAGSSAIAHCLYANQIKTGNYPSELDISDAAVLRQPFETLNQPRHCVDIIHKQTSQSFSEISSRTIQAPAPARSFVRKIQQQWRISSYSQLASGGYSEIVDRPDYDAVPNQAILPDTAQTMDELNRYSFHKGTRAGNFLHDILEHQPFDRPIDESLIQLKCREYGYAEEWIPCLLQWLDDVLSCNLGGLSLQQLASQQKLSEMEFYMSTHNLQADALNSLLHQYHYSRPEQSFSFSSINGFLKGFIDLVFEYQGRYFIADYKSNYLGPTREFYTLQYCKEAMFEHHYHLQYLIYTLAVHRYLRQRIKHYDYDLHFGGVYYLFLRGMAAGSDRQHGVFFDKPAYRLIQLLDQLFDE